MDLTIATAKFAIGKLTSEQAIATASIALDQGLNSDALVALVFQRPVWSDVGPLFEKALGDLGIVVPSRSVALRIVAREYARQIVEGVLSPYEGARRIWWEVANERDADRSLLNFVGLASEWQDDAEPEHRRQYEQDIVQEARSLLEGHRMAEPKDVYERG